MTFRCTLIINQISIYLSCIHKSYIQPNGTMKNFNSTTMKNIAYILATLTIVSASCKKDDKTNNGGGNNTIQSTQLDSFPLTVGNSWKYYSEEYVYDSTGAIYDN